MIIRTGTLHIIGGRIINTQIILHHPTIVIHLYPLTIDTLHFMINIVKECIHSLGLSTIRPLMVTNNLSLTLVIISVFTRTPRAEKEALDQKRVQRREEDPEAKKEGEHKLSRHS